MKVKCRGCGKQVEKSIAFLHEHYSKSGNKTNWWYCSEEEYESIENEKKFYKECQYALDSIFGETIVDNTRNKKLSELNKAGYTYETIYYCINDKTKDIEQALVIKREDFEGKNSMFLKLSYVFGIIKKEIHNYSAVSSKKEELEVDKIEEYTGKRSRNNPKPSLMDLIKKGAMNGKQ
ncbi:MAG: hypothetical protein ACRCTZ_04615 [Sarcina sp.]